VVQVGLCLYVPFKAKGDKTVVFFILSLLSLALFQVGSLLFFCFPLFFAGPALTLFASALFPVILIPTGQTLARTPTTKAANSWLAFYAFELVVLSLLATEILTGRMIDWVTGILDQPVFLIEKQRRFFFLNTAAACVIALLCFENTLRNASKPQQERLRYIFIGYLGIVFYFFYFSAQIVVSSYISQGLLLAGSILIFAGNLLIAYSLVRYPFWEITIFISRRVVFGCLSLSGLLLYLLASGWAMGLLNSIESPAALAIVPVALFFFVAVLLYLYLSPTLRKRVEVFVTHNFFRSKYDYRYLWMQFSEKLGGSINLSDILPKIADFVADCIAVRQVVIWLAMPRSSSFMIAHALDDAGSAGKINGSFRLDASTPVSTLPEIVSVSLAESPTAPTVLPLAAKQLRELNVNYVLPVRKSGEILAWVGIGNKVGDGNLSTEDEQLLTSIVNQLANLILTARLSSELLEARESESFNRLASFVMHDLKNLATQQSMVLENARNLRSNAEFLQDAFKTFTETTDKMISLIANLSVHKEHPSLEKKPVNIVELLKETLDDLKVTEKKGVELITRFPSDPSPLIIAGDPSMLEKAFTNILFNALQSLPNGKGTLQVQVSNPNGNILTSFTDNGCGISPENLRNLFRPFQTTKIGGLGIGLCHTRAIVENHGGHIRVESQLNHGTKVEIELPGQVK
jgi:putative PEP-CTERM system histidine kinase